MQKNEKEVVPDGSAKLLFSSGIQINKHFNLNQLISSGGFGQVLNLSVFFFNFEFIKFTAKCKMGTRKCLSII